MVTDDAGTVGLVAAGTPPAARGGSQPPCADRGVETVDGVRERFSTAVDFLTLTLSSEQAGSLMAETVLDEPGYPKRRFGQTEKRMALGGSCWRMWEPSQGANGFGRAYESWEFVGSVASVYARKLAGVGRPSRVDVAFDFACDDRLFVRRFVDRLAGRLRRDVVPEWSERGNDATFYLGARSSDWRIAIYRKDLQQGPLWDEAFPPVLRIEARLKSDLARDFWAAWAKSASDGFAMVAGRVEKWLGVAVMDQTSEWVETVKPQEFDHAQRLLAFMEQHGGAIDEFRRAGVPVLELAALASSKRSRVSRWRSESRLRQLLTASVPGVVDLVRKSLARPTGPGDSAAVPALATSGG